LSSAPLETRETVWEGRNEISGRLKNLGKTRGESKETRRKIEEISILLVIKSWIEMEF
jgi:hypothetical protein